MANVHWQDLTCTTALINPVCLGPYCEEWSWYSRRSANTTTQITWRSAKKGSNYATTWPVSKDINQCLQGTTNAQQIAAKLPHVCYPGTWNVNIPGLDTYYNNVSAAAVTPTCQYTGIVSKNNNIFVSTPTSINLLLSSYNTSSYFDKNYFFDPVYAFANIVAIAMDGVGKIYALDKDLNKVGSYIYDPTNTGNTSWIQFIGWGGFGGRSANTRFNSPTDIHIDIDNNVWVADNGNACIKSFSNTGAWTYTLIDDTNMGYNNPPISIALDSNGLIHSLTNNGVYVYNNSGVLQFNYKFSSFISGTPNKINCNQKKEIMYITFDNAVLKFFRNGVFAGYVVNNTPGVSGINAVYQDEFRNLLVTFGDKIYKDVDLMRLDANTGNLPASYWSLEDLLINQEEYVQSWVYNKSFQRLWDNIEMMRNTLFYTGGKCKSYTPPPYSKDSILIGQNEIVTSTVINRILGYLWANYSTLLKYFDPDCIN